MTESISAADKKPDKEYSQTREIWRRFRRNKGAMAGCIVVIIMVLIALFAGLFLNYDKQVIGQNIGERLQWPSIKHLFGTDELGRDIFFRILYGARFSIAVGVVAVAIGLSIGVTLGAVAGYIGGVTENLIMRFTDILQAIPGILMAIVIVAVIGQSTFNLMLAIGITSVPQFVRITRASVLTVKNEQYIESARSVGLSGAKIIFKHILPNCLSPIIVLSTLRVASAIIAASGLSFLGLGVPPPDPEWGGLLSAGRKYIRNYSYMTFFPGLAIMITVLALNLMGDGLRDALDPKLKNILK